jgi:hypothetical protein
MMKLSKKNKNKNPKSPIYYPHKLRTSLRNRDFKSKSALCGKKFIFKLLLRMRFDHFLAF